MGRRASSSSSSSIESSNHHFPRSSGSDLSTDLRLGLSIAASTPPGQSLLRQQAVAEEENECNSATFFVKVYMDGIPIGRKLNLLAHDGYHDMIRTLDHMFKTNILWSEAADVEGIQYENCHVLTYEDREGDWMMVGDVPWEMFLSCVRRLKITKC
ncbi:hypothetical protein SLE2022_241230 [Rubroshorea leprosula]